MIKEKYEIDEIILIEKTDKPRAVLEGLISPAKVLSLNEIFLATGDKEFKGILRESDKDNITKSEAFNQIAERLNRIPRIKTPMVNIDFLMSISFLILSITF